MGHGGTFLAFELEMSNVREGWVMMMMMIALTVMMMMTLLMLSLVDVNTPTANATGRPDPVIDEHYDYTIHHGCDFPVYPTRGRIMSRGGWHDYGARCYCHCQ